MKVQVSLNDELLKRIDNSAEDNYMSRSGFISFVMNNYLNQTEVVQAVKDMSVSMRKIADTGVVDEDTVNQLEDFERICKMYTGN